MDPFYIIPAKANLVPIILSVPHSGIEFPPEIMDKFKPEMIASPDDTDWFVHDLYDFLTEMGVTIIHAKYSRWVIDLNRDPESKPLYNDGRIITGLTPTTDFFGNHIYVSESNEPDPEEVKRRIEKYYTPYYRKIEALLQARKEQFGKVLLWDAHSIRHYVPTIREERFPDMILGSNDESSADPRLIRTALQNLKKSPFQINHNDPFKGGQITRNFGKPEEQIHALQLEMNKILYMDDDEKKYDRDRANRIRAVLKPTFEALIQEIHHL